VICDACRERRAAEREQALFDKAIKVSADSYDGPVWDGVDYFSDIADMLDVYACGGCKPPSYVWACTKSRLSLDASEIIDDALEAQEHHEDARDQLVDLGELQMALDEWCGRQTLESWFADYKVAVVLPQPKQGELL